MILNCFKNNTYNSVNVWTHLRYARCCIDCLSVSIPQVFEHIYQKRIDCLTVSLTQPLSTLTREGERLNVSMGAETQFLNTPTTRAELFFWQWVLLMILSKCQNSPSLWVRLPEQEMSIVWMIGSIVEVFDTVWMRVQPRSTTHLPQQKTSTVWMTGSIAEVFDIVWMWL